MVEASSIDEGGSKGLDFIIVRGEGRNVRVIGHPISLIVVKAVFFMKVFSGSGLLIDKINNIYTVTVYLISDLPQEMNVVKLMRERTIDSPPFLLLRCDHDDHAAGAAITTVVLY